MPPQLVYIPIKAVIFDFDGTLVDTHRYYFDLVAKKLGVNTNDLILLSNELIFSKTAEDERNVKWKILLAIFKATRGLGFSIVKALQMVYYVGRNHKKLFYLAKPTKDAEFALKRLQKAGIKIAIVSMSSRKKIDIFLNNHLKGDKYFKNDMIIGLGEFTKHKEEGFIHFLRKFDLTDDPRSCAIIGDLGGDIIAGKTIGMTTFGITTGYSSRTTLEKCRPDAIYDSILEMEKSIHLFLVEEK
ncbi:MAG: HAD family phosphatase [Candidatus Heimdallarchaeota archaeon]|nr:HAD family phosphatase [Candidatus Heimdallarchaeota archaeon]